MCTTRPLWAAAAGYRAKCAELFTRSSNGWGSAPSSRVMPAVSATVALQKEALTLGWAITASVNTLRSITGAVRIDRRALVELPGRSTPLDAAEVVGLAL